MPAPISVNDLSNDEFVNLISQYNIQKLAKEINTLKNGLVDVKWQALSPEKSNLLTQFYSSNPIYFADIETTPGTNGTINQKEGIFVAKHIPKNLNILNRACATLGINPIPYFRYYNRNYFIPNYEINPLYKVQVLDPNSQTYEFILRSLIKEGTLQEPLSELKYDKKPDFYIIDGVYYRVPHIGTVNRDPDLKQVYQKFTNKNTVEDFTTDMNAWIAFLNTLPKTTTVNDYGSHVDANYPTMISPLPGSLNKPIQYFEYNNKKYYIPKIKSVREKYPELYEEFINIIVKKREIKNSLADYVLNQIENDGILNQIINDGLIFESQFSCSKDPRWSTFVNEKILKSRERDPLLFFFSSIKPINRAYTNIDERTTYHKFNLSNTYVEQIPDGPWKAGIKSGEITEFTIYCNAQEINKTDEFNLCSQYTCVTRIPDSKGNIKETYFNFDTKTPILENRYTYDAVLRDSSNKIHYIIEFDGLDHYQPRTYKDKKTGQIKETNPTNKIISDQIKNNFARNPSDKESFIPCIRIPGFNKTKKTSFVTDFRNYIIELIKQRYESSASEPENVNSGIYTKAAYTIRKIIK